MSCPLFNDKSLSYSLIIFLELVVMSDKRLTFLDLLENVIKNSNQTWYFIVRKKFKWRTIGNVFQTLIITMLMSSMSNTAIKNWYLK